MLGRIKSAALKPLNNLIEKKAYSLLDSFTPTLFGSRPTYSGVNVGGELALTVPAVLQAVRLISENVGSLPVKLYRKTATGKEEATDHPAYNIVHGRANAWTGAGKLRADLTPDALIHGNGFAQVIRFDDGNPYAIHRLKPGSVSIYENTLTGAPVYKVTENGGTTDYSYTDILHLPSFLGASPIKLGKEAIGLASIMEHDVAQFFASGRQASGVISNEKPQGNEAGARTMERIRASWDEWRKGSGPLILDSGWKHEQNAMSSTDAQFVENRKFQIDEVARIFGVPPHLLFEMARATWSNAETMGATFLTLCLKPWLDRWTDALATALLTEEEQADYYFEFITDDLLRADAAARTANMTALVTNRIMTPNEVRAILNLQPLPGGDELVNPHTTSSAAPAIAPAPAKEAA